MVYKLNILQSIAMQWMAYLNPNSNFLWLPSLVPTPLVAPFASAQAFPFDSSTFTRTVKRVVKSKV